MRPGFVDSDTNKLALLFSCIAFPPALLYAARALALA